MEFSEKAEPTPPPPEEKTNRKQIKKQIWTERNNCRKNSSAPGLLLSPGNRLPDQRAGMRRDWMGCWSEGQPRLHPPEDGVFVPGQWGGETTGLGGKQT